MIRLALKVNRELLAKAPSFRTIGQKALVRVKNPTTGQREWQPHDAPATEQHITQHLLPRAYEAQHLAHEQLSRLMNGLHVSISGRAKEPHKIAEKMFRPGKQPRHYSQLGDTVGLRVTVHDPAHFEEAHRRLQAHLAGGGHPHLRLHEHEDFNAQPIKETGYRSVHFNGQGKHGVRMEVQLRHPWQNVWADHAHDHFYKDSHLKSRVPKHEVEHVKSAGTAYMKQVAEHLAANGGKAGASFPKAPASVKKYGLEFPVHKL